MRAQFAGRSKLGFGAPRRYVGGRLRLLGQRLKRLWAHFRDHSLFAALLACYAIVLAALYLPVGSKLMLGWFVVTVTIFTVGVLARFTNGWHLVAIAVVQGALVLLSVRGVEALGVTGLSELGLLQVTIPLPLAYGWLVDRDERELDLLEQPVAQ